MTYSENDGPYTHFWRKTNGCGFTNGVSETFDEYFGTHDPESVATYSESEVQRMLNELTDRVGESDGMLDIVRSCLAYYHWVVENYGEEAVEAKKEAAEEAAAAASKPKPTLDDFPKDEYGKPYIMDKELEELDESERERYEQMAEEAERKRAEAEAEAERQAQEFFQKQREEYEARLKAEQEKQRQEELEREEANREFLEELEESKRHFGDPE